MNIVGMATDLAGEDFSKLVESIVESFAIQIGCKALNNDVSSTTLADGRVAVRHHDTHGTTIQRLVIQTQERLFRCVCQTSV